MSRGEPANTLLSLCSVQTSNGKNTFLSIVKYARTKLEVPDSLHEALQWRSIAKMSNYFQNQLICVQFNLNTIIIEYNIIYYTLYQSHILKNTNKI